MPGNLWRGHKLEMVWGNYDPSYLRGPFSSLVSSCIASRLDPGALLTSLP